MPEKKEWDFKPLKSQSEPWIPAPKRYLGSLTRSLLIKSFDSSEKFKPSIVEAYGKLYLTFVMF